MTTTTARTRRVPKRPPRKPSTENQEVPTPASASDGSTLDVMRLVQRVPLSQLHRHAANRNITPASVAELAESLREFGQKEPIRVRPLEQQPGHFEILSGERRFVAAGVAQLTHLEALIEHHDAPEAMIELAVANAARKDLDPIERAELLTQLMLPVDQGGGGLDRMAAGRVLGLNSDSGIKNTLRLLTLPAFFRGLLKAGTLNVKLARVLVPYGSSYLESLATWLGSKDCPTNALEDFYRSEEDMCWVLEEFERKHTRPADDKANHYHGYQNGGYQPCLFDPDALDAAARTLLNFAEIPNREHDAQSGETRLVSLNPKAWHKLQDPLVKDRLKQDRLKQGRAKGKAGAKKTPNTGAKPAETAAELKARRKQQDEQLARFTRDWIRVGLRYLLSCRLEWSGGCFEYVLPWLLVRLERDRSFGDPSLSKLHDWAASQCAPPPSKPLSQLTADEQAKFLDQALIGFYVALWRVSLWPMNRDATPTHSDLALQGQIPEQLPRIDDLAVDALARMVGVSVETLWEESTGDGIGRRLVLQWLSRHNRDQLTALAKKLKVPLKSTKRGDMAAELLERHTQLSKLPIPAVLLKLAKGGRR